MSTVNRKCGSCWAAWIWAIALRSGRRDPPAFPEPYLPTALWVRHPQAFFSLFAWSFISCVYSSSVLPISCVLMQLAAVVMVRFWERLCRHVLSKGQANTSEVPDAHAVYLRCFAHWHPVAIETPHVNESSSHSRAFDARFSPGKLFQLKGHNKRTSFSPILSWVIIFIILIPLKWAQLLSWCIIKVRKQKLYHEMNLFFTFWMIYHQFVFPGQCCFSIISKLLVLLK